MTLRGIIEGNNIFQKTVDVIFLQGNITYRLVGVSPAPFMFIVDSSTGEITLARDILTSGLNRLNEYTVSIERYFIRPKIKKS